MKFWYPPETWNKEDLPYEPVVAKAKVNKDIELSSSDSEDSEGTKTKKSDAKKAKKDKKAAKKAKKEAKAKKLEKGDDVKDNVKDDVADDKKETEDTEVKEEKGVFAGDTSESD